MTNANSTPNHQERINAFTAYNLLCKEVEKATLELGMTLEEVQNTLSNEGEKEIAKLYQNKLGFFITPQNFLTNWIEKRMDFSCLDVSDAKHALCRSTAPEMKKELQWIWEAMEDLSQIAPTSQGRARILMSEVFEVHEANNL